MIIVLTGLIAFIGMEFVAWAAHKYLMHGLLWSWHVDHHRKNPKSVLEKNDRFFLVFAIPGALSIIIGSMMSFYVLFSVGVGIALYGLAYFLVHDVFIHQRIKWFRKSNNRYFKALRRAHKIHHKHLNKEDGECFGMLLFPLKYLRS